MPQFAHPSNCAALEACFGVVRPSAPSLGFGSEPAPPAAKTVRRKIVFYIHALSGGGAERVWAMLATGLAAAGHDVLLIVDRHAIENLEFVGPNVQIVILGGGNLRSTISLFKILRYERPDLSISALSSANLKHVVAALFAKRLHRCVITYHGYFFNERGALSRLGYFATPIVTRLAAKTVAVSDGLAEYLRRGWKASTKNLERIYNPVACNSHNIQINKGGHPVVLAIGRLDRAKDHATLLSAFARVRVPGVRLVILGEGAERSALESQIERLNLTGRVSLPGYTNNISKYFSVASCFVMSSKVEAFGLSIVESLAYGVHVIATDCDGPREIISHPELGTIVPVGDPDAMAIAIEQALNTEFRSDRRRRRASDFAVEHAISEYESLMKRIIRLSDSPSACISSPASYAGNTPA